MNSRHLLPECLERHTAVLIHDANHEQRRLSEAIPAALTQHRRSAIVIVHEPELVLGVSMLSQVSLQFSNDSATQVLTSE